jgi:hypothetical protein
MIMWKDIDSFEENPKKIFGVESNARYCDKTVAEENREEGERFIRGFEGADWQKDEQATLKVTNEITKGGNTAETVIVYSRSTLKMTYVSYQSYGISGGHFYLLEDMKGVDMTLLVVGCCGGHPMIHCNIFTYHNSDGSGPYLSEPGEPETWASSIMTSYLRYCSDKCH